MQKIKLIIHNLQIRFYKRKLAKAVQRAEQLYKATRKHHLVLRFQDTSVMIVPRSEAKQMIAQKLLPYKNIEALEKDIYYTTR